MSGVYILKVERKRIVNSSKLKFLQIQVVLVAVSDIGALEPGLDAQSSISIVVRIMYLNSSHYGSFWRAGGHIHDVIFFMYLAYF